VDNQSNSHAISRFVDWRLRFIYRVQTPVGGHHPHVHWSLWQRAVYRTRAILEETCVSICLLRSFFLSYSALLVERVLPRHGAHSLPCLFPSIILAQIWGYLVINCHFLFLEHFALTVDFDINQPMTLGSSTFGRQESSTTVSYSKNFLGGSPSLLMACSRRIRKPVLLHRSRRA
jgi:hypothetical protein